MAASVYPFQRPDFGDISYAAYKLLLAQKTPRLGMSANEVIIPGKRLVFSTIQDYSEITGVNMDDLTVGGKISLGCHVNINDKIYILLHNKDIITPYCENWTNIHEIGHIYIGHEKNGDKEEVEAHFFTSCFLMPDPVIRYLRDSDLNITSRFLVRHFNVSPEAAAKKIHTLSKGDFETDLDDKIIKALYNDICDIINKERKSFFVNFTALEGGWP